MSTPLELLFDLVFVVAIAFAGAQLHHALSANHAVQGLLGFGTVFFAIWWAWMGFTWFASAFDVDDVPYRIAVWVQMAGALTIAAGVDGAFEKSDLTFITFGYVVMRIASVAQWLRASLQNDGHRKTCQRYALGISLVQLGWLVNLSTPPSWKLVTFLLLAACELAVPLWAERAGNTPWHPHHIAERYGLMTIIVLGESVLAAASAMRTATAEGLLGLELIVLGIGALLVIFCMWWLYFEGSAAEQLTDARKAFFWGYGHLVVFASAAATGAGLAVQIDLLTGKTQLSHQAAAAALAVPVALYVVVTWVVHKKRDRSRWSLPVVAALILATPWMPMNSALLTGLILMGALIRPLSHRRG